MSESVLPSAVVSALLSHRSIRTYTDEPIPENDIRRAVEAGQMAASSSAVQAYSVLRVRDGAKRARLAEIAGPQPKVAQSPAFFVICGDSRRHRVLCERAGHTYDQRLEAFLVAVIDASLFAQNMVVALEAMGYGTCYIGGLRNDLDAVNEVLNLPEGVYPLYGLCVGKPAEDPMTRPRLGVDGVLFDETYPSDDELVAAVDAYDERYRRYLEERGAEPRKWGGIMAAKYAKPSREHVAPFFTAQGANIG